MLDTIKFFGQPQQLLEFTASLSAAEAAKQRYQHHDCWCTECAKYLSVACPNK